MSIHCPSLDTQPAASDQRSRGGANLAFSVPVLRPIHIVAGLCESADEEAQVPPLLGYVAVALRHKHAFLCSM